jgi:putative endonuclease
MQLDQFREEKIELRVLNWLAEKGFELIRRNWQYCHSEVDIIASRFDKLHFIGITTMNYPEDGLPTHGVTRRKMLSILQASQQYLKRNPEWKEAVIDILTVTLVSEEPKDCILIKNIKMV